LHFFLRGQRNLATRRQLSWKAEMTEEYPGFANVAHPTREELVRWAYSDEDMPCEDFELMIADKNQVPTLMPLVADPACPNRRTLLAALYIWVGDAVRSHHSLASKREIKRMGALAEAFNEPWLTVWAARSRRLMHQPGTFNYDDWCSWGLTIIAEGDASPAEAQAKYRKFSASMAEHNAKQPLYSNSPPLSGYLTREYLESIGIGTAGDPPN
jgi:hypothetical protein